MAELDPKKYGWEDETDLQAVMTTPRRWYPLFFIALITGMVVSGITYLKQINNINKNYVNTLVYREAPEEEDQFMLDLAIENNLKAAEEMNADVKAKVHEIKNSSVAPSLKGVVHCTMRMGNTLASNRSWISNYDAFKKMIIDNVPNNGFTSDVTELSNDELMKIHGVLSSIYN